MSVLAKQILWFMQVFVPLMVKSRLHVLLIALLNTVVFCNK